MRWVLLSIAIVLLLGVVSLSAFVVWQVALTTTPASGGIACTAEAMQCPGGSWVGRTGPNCEFVCPAASTTPTGGPGEGIVPYNSGISGVVMLGPTCPVEQYPPSDTCADKPYSTLVAIFRTSDPVHALVITRSASDGTFKVSLPPGDYVVGVGESMLPRCAQTPAEVGPAGYTQVEVSCDTGIR